MGSEFLVEPFDASAVSNELFIPALFALAMNRYSTFCPVRPKQCDNDYRTIVSPINIAFSCTLISRSTFAAANARQPELTRVGQLVGVGWRIDSRHGIAIAFDRSANIPLATLTRFALFASTMCSATKNRLSS
ncbi:hypothetical protein RSSM_06429 [Rhodopirellula sallentina SM41]|uniref:Uncharacterized protein n=1 Tax=Rhodopirellula sallentina SM41 TaxID=1263870 RepID=M5U860_9BACT|nr:hypothetical protein RSSM_06429 [Rhodopirellula sallentina SM41]